MSDVENQEVAPAAPAAPVAPAAPAPTGFDALAGLGTNAAPPVYEQQLDKFGRAYATGKRKNAIAKVWIKPGSGKITINDRDQEIYFARPVLRMIIAQPLQVTDRLTQFDVIVSVS